MSGNKHKLESSSDEYEDIKTELEYPVSPLENVASSSRQTPSAELPDAPNGHEAFFDRCKQVLARRNGYDNANAELKKALFRYCILVKSSDRISAVELSSAQENLEARTQNLDTEQVALRECKEQLNTALSHVTKSFATITSQDPGFLAPYPHLKTWLKNLVAAREAGSSAQTKVNNAKDKYELAQERHNVAKSRVEMEQRIRHVKARIESNLSIGN